MATTKHKAYGAAVTVLSTELNALATAANSAASAAHDNSTALELLVDAELLVTFAAAPTEGSVVTLFHLPSVDGTNFATDSEISALPLCVFTLDNVTTAQRVVRTDLPITPGTQKFFARNASGQAFPATGSTVKIRPHSIDSA